MFITNETLAAWGSPVRAKKAMVASQQKLASEVGAEIMRKGGNAVDAAVAVGFALAVVYPDAGNIGGGGFMMIRFADGRATAIDYRETAPALATRDMFVNQNGGLIAGEGSSTVGYRAAATPGTVAGLDFALKKYGSGKFTFAQLIEPARRLAANGFVLSNFYAELLKEYKNLSAYEDSNRIFLKNGEYYKWGETLRQPELAATLNRLQKFGARDFYSGATAKMIADDMKRHNGLITLDDLKNYTVKERAPVRGNYRGYDIISMPPPSSGAIVLFNALNILEGYDVRRMGWSSSEKYHVLIEAFRRAYADRAVFVADPDFGEIPVEKLSSKDYAAQRRATIDLKSASKSADVKAGEVSTGREGMETTHYTVVDPAGNVVSNTYTVNDLFGSGATVKGAGFLLNDIMDDFTAQPGKPNLWGVLQGERNRVEPRKRPLSSMSPTIVLRKDGKLWFSVGARGGPTIISAVAQILVNIIDHDMNLQQAIDAPRLHHQWFPDEIKFEPFGLSADTRGAMEKMGHVFAERPGYIASATGIMIDEKNGDRLGAVDSRRDGEPIGF